MSLKSWKQWKGAKIKEDDGIKNNLIAPVCLLYASA
jgi:hypothetical protein